MNPMKYLAFIRIGFKEATAYRLNAFMSFANSVLYLIMAYAIWAAIAASGTLASSLAAVMTYLVVGQIVSRTAFTSVENLLGEKIREGTIANELKRPLSLRIQAYCHLLGRAVFNGVAIAAPMTVIGVVFLDLSFPPLPQLAAFFGSVFLAFNLVFMLSFSTAMLIFWTKVDWSIRQMRHTMQDLFSGVLFPLYLLPPWLVGVFDVLPFKYMVDAPISIFRMEATGAGVLTVYGQQLAWILVLALLGEFMWRRAKKKITVQGG